MEKRGQVTVYIIIGLMILFIVTAFLIWKQDTQVINEFPTDAQTQFMDVYNHIQQCIGESADNAVVLNGMKGGLYAPREYVFGETRPPVTKFYQKGIVIDPSNEDVEELIGLEFIEYYSSCLEYYESEITTIEFDDAASSVSVSIIQNEIIFQGYYPVKASKESKSQTFSEFTHRVENVRLFTILDLARELSYIQSTDPGYICLSCTVEMADENFMYVDFTDIGDNSTAYSFTDLFSSINDEPYVFVMAHEH